MILVTGATGPVGSHVVAQLVAAGEQVRALTRDPKKARLPEEVELVEGDLADPETLKPAVDGAERLCVILPTFGAPETRTYDRNLLQAARGGSVKHLVRLSVIATQDDGAVDAHTSFHRDGEQAVRDSGIPWTFLRPGQFMTNALSWAETVKTEGFVREPFAHVKQAPIDPEDIAATAVTVLRSSGHEGKAYPLSGPEALSIEDQVAVLAGVLGRELKTVNVPPDVAKAEWLNEGYPEGMVTGIMRHMADESGVHGVVHRSVEEITGNPATSFEQWARKNVDSFR